MSEDEIAKAAVEAAYDLHVRRGPGILESVCQELIACELNKLKD